MNKREEEEFKKFEDDMMRLEGISQEVIDNKNLKIDLLVELFDEFELDPPRSKPELNLEDFNFKREAGKMLHEWHPYIKFMDLAYGAGIEIKPEDLKPSDKNELIYTSVNLYLKHYELVAKYILKPAYRKIKSRTKLTSGFVYNYFKNEHKNEKYAILLRKVEPIIRNAEAHKSWEYDAENEQLIFKDDIKGESLTIDTEEFISQYVTDIQLIWSLATTRVAYNIIMKRRDS